MAKKTVVRTSISIPPDLKRQMSKVTEEVNWSGIACDAFRAKLVEIAAKKEVKTMDDVIERLRVSKRKSDSEKKQEGLSAGKQWAEKWAEAAELERLENFDTSMREVLATGSAYSYSDFVCFALRPETDGSRVDAEMFWEEAVGDDEASKRNLDVPDFIDGFVEGAVEVWQQVKDRL